MKVTVVGTGYVGLVTGVTLAEIGHYVNCVDIDHSKIDMLKRGLSPIYEKDMEYYLEKNKDRLNFTTDYNVYNDCEVLFIGVGTPEKEDGSANLSYVKRVCEDIVKYVSKDLIVVIKSTVPIGTNDEIDSYFKSTGLSSKVYVVSNPEFLSQGTAINDVFNAKRIIIGSNDDYAIQKMKKLYEPFIESGIPFLVMDRKSSEMVKYASNSFLATKISFINEISNLCEVLGADVNSVALGMGYDDRIGNKFLKPGIGYGGSCFPKDTKALVDLANKNNYNLEIVSSTISVNEKQKRKCFDILKGLINDLNNKDIAILGVTFKPGTDDLRDSPSLKNIDLLLDESANVRVYDPVGLENLKKMYGDTIKYFNSISETIKNCEAVLIMTEWDEIKYYNYSCYKKLMSNPIVIDGRNCYNKKEMKDNGIDYYCIGG